MNKDSFFSFLASNKDRISISRRFVFVHASQAAAATIYGALAGEIVGFDLVNPLQSSWIWD